MRSNASFVLAQVDKYGRPTHFLMIIRARWLNGGGELALPGGMLNRGEDHKTACLREAFEETGLMFNLRYGRRADPKRLQMVYETPCGNHKTFLVTTKSQWDRMSDARHCHNADGAPSANECEDWLTGDKKFPAVWVSLQELRDSKGVYVPSPTKDKWVHIPLWHYAKISINGALRTLGEPLIP